MSPSSRCLPRSLRSVSSEAAASANSSLNSGSEAIVSAALPYGVFGYSASTGPMQSTRNGNVAPIEFRIVYSRQGGLEIRQSIVQVRLNTSGWVLAAL